MKKVLAMTGMLMLLSARLYAGNGDMTVEGRLGVGTETPAALLEINSINDNWASGWNNNLRLTSNYPALRFYAIGANKTSMIGNDNDGGLWFGVNGTGDTWGTYGMVILPSGNVGIGKTNPDRQLHLSMDSAAKPGTSTWEIWSDARVKTNIQPFKDGLNVVLGINPVTYRYNGKGGIPETETLKDNIGIVAQEIQKVAPYTVGKFKAKFNKEDVAETELLSFNSHALIFVLINAIKEQQKEIEDLKALINKPNVP